MRKFLAYFFLFLMMMQSPSGWAARGYDIQQMTPEIEQAFASRKSRFEELRGLKAAGRIGENNHGYVEALDKSQALNGLVQAENSARHVIYNAIVGQNGLGPNGLPQVEAAFAAVKREKAQAGDFIQSPSGDWTQK